MPCFNVFSNGIIVSLGVLLKVLFAGKKDCEKEYHSLREDYYDKPMAMIKRVNEYPYLEEARALGLNFKLKSLRNANPVSDNQKIFDQLSPTPLKVKETLVNLYALSAGTVAFHAVKMGI